jgi:hypothetical protein
MPLLSRLSGLASRLRTPISRASTVVSETNISTMIYSIMQKKRTASCEYGCMTTTMKGLIAHWVSCRQSRFLSAGRRQNYPINQWTLNPCGPKTWSCHLKETSENHESTSITPVPRCRMPYSSSLGPRFALFLPAGSGGAWWYVGIHPAGACGSRFWMRMPEILKAAR